MKSYKQLIEDIAKYLYKFECDIIKIEPRFRNYDLLPSKMKRDLKSRATTLYHRIFKND